MSDVASLTHREDSDARLTKIEQKLNVDRCLNAQLFACKEFRKITNANSPTVCWTLYLWIRCDEMGWSSVHIYVHGGLLKPCCVRRNDCMNLSIEWGSSEFWWASMFNSLKLRSKEAQEGEGAIESEKHFSSLSHVLLRAWTPINEKDNSFECF